MALGNLPLFKPLCEAYTTQDQRKQSRESRDRTARQEHSNFYYRISVQSLMQKVVCNKYGDVFHFLVYPLFPKPYLSKPPKDSEITTYHMVAVHYGLVRQRSETWEALPLP